MPNKRVEAESDSDSDVEKNMHQNSSSEDDFEDHVPSVDNTSDSEEEEDDEDEDDSSYEEVDITDNEFYQVLSAFLETEEGVTITDSMQEMNNNILRLTEVLSVLTKTVAEMKVALPTASKSDTKKTGRK